MNSGKRAWRSGWLAKLMNSCASSPNVELAHEFISFASHPERQARFPEFIANGPAIVAANDHVPAETAPLLPTTPVNMEVSFQMDTAFWVENIESLTERFDRWVTR